MSVELLRSYGTDLDIVNAARVSFHKQSEWRQFYKCMDCGRVVGRDQKGMASCSRAHPTESGRPCSWTVMGRSLSDGDQKLIGFLMKNQHATPFEMVDFTFRVRCPIGVAREWMRHRVFSFNEESTRYVEMRPDFYVPPPEAMRTQVGKPGAYTMEPIEDGALTAVLVDRIEQSYERSYEAYKRLLDMGLAREVARNVLPLGLLTEFIVKGNLRSWLHFLHLRTAPNALLEIRQEAQAVENFIKEVVPVAYQAWVDAGRPSM